MAWLHAALTSFWQAFVKLLVAAQNCTIKSDVTVVLHLTTVDLTYVKPSKPR